jgi:branched-chain amino acid transport system permease protein
MVTGEIKRMKVQGVSVLIVEHRLALLNNVADSVLAMVAGTAVAEGAMAEVLRNPIVEEAFLGTGGGVHREIRRKELTDP